ncbi:hypothetical protein [Thermococcus barossii]|uniref:DUF4349 domain-containing protein n=1 Tax=Thermococcus barossii TaxID=54077 RepID=A0A2Z2MHJ9_9EURY|nr:hypothetical protein [Thermococcus barossii]ASJ04205.1 hypothetical protein A3L01_02040 [Thermococcus barossii]
MEGKKNLILAVAPFVIFIVLGSIFAGTYYRETSLAREQLTSMDELEKLGEKNAPSGGLCNIVDIYILVRGQKDASELEEFLRKEGITVEVSRRGERIVTMRGRVALRDVNRIVNKSEKNGWPVFYHNNSDSCTKEISRFKRENEIITAHLDEVSPENREVLMDVVERNEKAIGGIEEDTREWASLEIFVHAGPAYTPQSFHELSGFLAMWGVMLGVPFLMWWLFGSKGKNGKE